MEYRHCANIIELMPSDIYRKTFNRLPFAKNANRSLRLHPRAAKAAQPFYWNKKNIRQNDRCIGK